MEESRFQRIMNKIGFICFLIFFVISTIMVIRNSMQGGGFFSGGAKRLTFAHWQLEDGFREGYADAIIEYEKMKAKEGVKVKVIQTTVPARGYAQWFLTQLIGGDCADVIELSGTEELHNQYFLPLSQYLAEENPYNKGTPLEGMAWRDTFADDMVGALSTTYSEYFGVSTFMCTTRMYVNVELYQAATGHTRLPNTLGEWIDSCKKILEYGNKIGKPLIPVGVRGFDKGTINQICAHFNNILNADYNDSLSDYGYGVGASEMIHKLANGDKSVDLNRLLAPAELTVLVGKYFAKGFPAIDLEQTKFLFSSGTVGYFIDGTYNAFSMVNNSKFKVDVIPLPVIGDGFEYQDLGRMTEIGSGIGGRFGIPKAAKDIDLAIDFLKYITSYKISQLTMIRHSKWGSPLKRVDYREAFGPEISAMCHCPDKGKMTQAQIDEEVALLEKCRPFEGAGYTGIALITQVGNKTQKDMTLVLEDLIINQPENPKKEYWNAFLSKRKQLLNELNESIIYDKRTSWNLDGMRTAFAIGELGAVSPSEKKTYNTRYKLNQEGLISRFKNLTDLDTLTKDILNLKEIL